MHRLSSPILAAVAFLACTVLPLYPENLQSIFAADAPAVERSRRLMTRAGIVPLFGDGPYSAAELKNELYRIDPALLQPAGRAELDALLAELTPAPGYREGAVFGFSATPQVALESYLNLRGPGFPWVHDVADRRPLLSLPLEAWIAESAYANMRPDVRKNYPDYENHITDKAPETVNPDPYANVMSNIREIDAQFPHQGFLSFGGAHWNLQFGRDHLSWGYGRTGNLIVSDYADYHDYLRLSAFFDRFKFQTVWMSLEPWLTAEEEAESTPPDLHKSFLAHRFNVRLGGWGNLSYTEAVMFGRDDLELRYLNPLVSYHNWFVNPDLTNTIHSLELEVVPAPGLLGYAALAMDQWTAPVESGSYTEDEPDALGYLAGVSWLGELWNGRFKLNGEWVRTDPWLYIGPYPHTTFYTRRRVQAENVEPATKVLLDKPLGFKYGPDALLYSLFLEYREQNRFALAVDGTLRYKGENSIERLLPPDDKADAKRVTPSGDHPQRSWELTLSAEAVPLPLLGIRPAAGWATELRMGSDLTFVWIKNRGAEKRKEEFDLQLVTWLSFEL